MGKVADAKRTAAGADKKTKKSMRPNQLQKKVKVAKDFRASVNEDALQEIDKLLRASPDEILPCLGALRTHFFADKPDFVQSDSWPITYMRLDQVPKYWLLKWCKDNLSDIIKESELDLVNASSKTGIKELVEFLSGRRMHGKLPRLCLFKQVLSLTLKHFLGCTKRLTHEWWKIVFDPDTGKLNWNAPGAGVVDYHNIDGSRVTKLKHVSGILFDADEDINILAAVPLVKNYSDWDCEYSKGKVSIKFVQQEADLKAVMCDATYEKFKEVAETIHADLEKKEADAEQGTVVATPLKVVKKKTKTMTPPATAPCVKASGHISSTVSPADAAGGS